MYFTNTPSLNSMEAIMKQPPGYRQRGGGRKRKPYQYRNHSGNRPEAPGGRR